MSSWKYRDRPIIFLEFCIVMSGCFMFDATTRKEAKIEE